MTLKLKVDIRPKQRPRKAKSGHIYSPVDPSHTELQKLYKYYMHENNITMIPKGINMILDIKIWITHNAGDLSNIIKVIEDCANKILWYDDKAVIGYNNPRLYRGASEGKMILRVFPLNYLLENECNR